MRTMTLLTLLTLSGGATAAHADELRYRCGQLGRFDRLQAVGLTGDQRLICFDERFPQISLNIGAVTGLVGDSRLVGIDYRPATGDLYGLGDTGGVYTLDVTTAEATFKARLDVALAGTSFGVDFNPTVDRLRIVSDAGQNLRANVETGATLVDAALNYPAPATGVTAVGYTNNDADAATATTLYDVDTVLDQVAIQAPPNNGSLNPTGKLGVDAGSAAGFDIASLIANGTTRAVRGLAALTTEGRARLFELNLFTGRATLRGTFRERDQVVDVAIPLDQGF